ncbi:MAG TPA: HPr(Ser) kinase/phosphatase [Gemmatimonadaceae bacterium]|nr:HPr(Ser) kinase/phosphatase [Gemmatimonadaceae bacterium]
MTLTVGQLFERMEDTLQLEQIGSAEGLAREVTTGEAQSPGLALTGWTGRFLWQRIQVIGETEVMYLNSQPREERHRVLDHVFSHRIPCVFVMKSQDPPDGLLEAAMKTGTSVFRSKLKTAEFYKRLNPFLENEFAPTTSVHGSLSDIFGVGVLFTGSSGIGKSECVLDLVERGHRLVADDVVIVRRRGQDVLIGRGHELQRHFMEIRGVGLIDVPSIFGIHAVRQQKRIEVVVRLERWDAAEGVDRTGLDDKTTTILEVDLPLITVPLNPGKNITVIAEVIAMNHLLRYSGGVNSAEAFNQRLIGRMKRGNAKQYLQEDVE